MTRWTGGFAPGAPETLAECLAVDGDEPSTGALDQRRGPVHEALLERHRIERGEDAVERVVTGDAVGKVEERFEPVAIHQSPGFHRDPAIGAAQHGEDRDRQKTLQRMRRVGRASIGDVSEKAQKTFGRLGVHAQAPFGVKDGVFREASPLHAGSIPTLAEGRNSIMMP